RKLPHISWFLVILAMHALAHSVYPQTWHFHGAIRYGWGPGEIGFSLTMVGVVDAFVQAVLLGIVLKKFGPERTLFIGLIVSTFAFLGFSMAGVGWIALLIIPFTALSGVIRPSLMTMMSNRTPADAQGELQGATAAMGSLAMIISPLVMTSTLEWFVSEDAPIYFPGAAFFLAATLTALCFIPYALAARSRKVDAIN
ncbi:MAG: MFS transporter, partial [Pseudomonadota bacterium]